MKKQEEQMKYFGIWNDYGRRLGGLVSEKDFEAFATALDAKYKEDDTGGQHWWTEEEVPGVSAAPIYTLKEALAEISKEHWLKSKGGTCDSSTES